MKIKPRFSFHYVAYTTLFLLVVFSVISVVTATTPNPGHPWSELGDGVFVFTNSQTTTPYTYTFPAANSTVLTTNAAVTVAQGGTGLGTIAAGSVFGANSLDTLSAITSISGTKVLTNTAGTITWEVPSSGMVYPGSGIPNSTGSAWGTSYSTTGSGTVLALATTPTFTTNITTPLVLGGTSTTQDLSFQTTSGTGATGADMHFLVGSAGGTEAMTILNDGKVGINNTNPTTHQLMVNGSVQIGGGFSYTPSGSTDLTVGNASDNSRFLFGQSNTAYGGMQWLYSATPSAGYLTVGTMNGDGTKGFVIYQSGNIGVGQGSPTALLHLKAGTATANTAPLKFNSGTVLSTTEAGAVEFDGTHLYFTVTNGGSRYQLDQQGGTGANSLGTYIVQTATNAPVNAQVLASLGTGIVKNTTTTGVLSIAVAGDFPTLNQSTTGSAATLTTPRAIYGNNFDGSTALTQIIASTYGGTGNGFAKFTGPTTSEKTFTLPDSSETLLYSGGALGTPSSGVATNLTGTASSLSIGGTAAKATNLVGGNSTTLLGSIPYQSNTDTTSLLSPNTSATKMYLSMTGTGTNGAVPVWDTIAGGGDMVLASTQTNSGAKTFLDGTLLMRNVANTFNGKFTNTNTADHTYTLPNRDLTIDNITTSTTTTGTGFLKGNGSVISFDNTSYLPLTGGTLTGNLLFTDNTYDIGATGATRPRTGYFGTSLVSPLILGGSSTTQDLTLQTTSGTGATGADMHFLVGSAGGTEALTILNNGNVGVGIASPSQLFSVGNNNQFTVSSAGLITAQSASIGATGVQSILISGSGSSAEGSPNGTYAYVGQYNSANYYRRGTDNFYIWWNTSLSAWYMSIALGNQSHGWYKYTTVVGTWSNDGTTGTTTGATLPLSQLVIDSTGQLTTTSKALIGGITDSSTAKLYVEGTATTNSSSTAIAGILGGYTLTNAGAANYVQVGNRFVITNSPTTNPNTAVGEIIRIVDSSGLANLVRGLEITSSAGTNTAGTNTGIRSTGATFGVQGITTGLAGGSSIPAALYGENQGTTNGDVLRLYSNSVSSAPSFATFYHDSSTFTGTGLLMDFATGSGGFTGNFLDFQKNNTSLFKVTNAGIVSMGLPTNASTATSALCSTVANATSPTAGTAYEIRDCSAAPVADYAEMYPVESDVEFGDVVAMGSEMVNTYDTNNGEIDWNKVKGKITRLVKSDKEYQKSVIGIVSNNYGDFSSVGYNIKETDNPKPVALNGRVPVKISSSSASIKAGDYVTSSTDLGKATKAIRSGFVIGKALEDWDSLSGVEMIMVYVEQGYYDGPDLNEMTVDGLTFFESDSEFIKNVVFKSQVEFAVPPLFNNDTAGFAVIKKGTREVRVSFDEAYVATPVVNTTITFDKIKVPEGEDAKIFDAESFFDSDIKSVVAEKDETGFNIVINKTAPQDIRFSWIALAVKDPKVFESVIEGLVIEQGISTPADTTIGIADTTTTTTTDTTALTIESQIVNTASVTLPGDSTSIIDTIINSDIVQSVLGNNESEGKNNNNNNVNNNESNNTEQEENPVIAPEVVEQVPSSEPVL